MKSLSSGTAARAPAEPSPVIPLGRPHLQDAGQDPGAAP